MTRQLGTTRRVRETPEKHVLLRILFPESLLYVLWRDGYIYPFYKSFRNNSCGRSSKWKVQLTNLATGMNKKRSHMPQHMHTLVSRATGGGKAEFYLSVKVGRWEWRETRWAYAQGIRFYWSCLYALHHSKSCVHQAEWPSIWCFIVLGIGTS
jgi:hypothetical protein